tara:strand:- start:3636 stop:3839 length:204 start_codon:yes stop_codon:yes gene_type:complete
MKTQFITDNSGQKLAVILPIKDYNRMIEELEDLEDVKLYDKVKADNEPSIPIDEAFKMIEEERKNKK